MPDFLKIYVEHIVTDNEEPSGNPEVARED